MFTEHRSRPSECSCHAAGLDLQSLLVERFEISRVAKIPDRHSLSRSPYFRMVAETMVMDSPFFSLLWLRRNGRLSCVFIFRHWLMIFLVSLASVETVMCFSCTVLSTNNLSVSTWTLFTQMRFLSICSTLSSSMRFWDELVALMLSISPRGWRWPHGVGRGCQNGRCRRGG